MTGGGFTLVDNNDSSNAGHFSGHAYIRGPSFLHLPILTVSLLGVQIFWSVEMSYASPYLLSLGLSKSHMAIVFLAGPLSGLLMQPLIGVMADSSTSRWGRRRPYMMIGTVLCVLAMLLLGWTRQVAEWFTNNAETLTLWLAVISIFLIDFSINAVQAVDRALIVDILPSSLQPAGNAWAARMLGIGSVIGFFVGNLDLPTMLPILGSTELQIISVLVSLILLGSQLVTAVMVNEKVLLKGSGGVGGPLAKSFTQEVRDIFANMWSLPRVIRQICFIQFFAWISWFPILFYTTVYVGDLHRRSFYEALHNAMANSQNSGNTARTLLNRSLHHVSSHLLPIRQASNSTESLDLPAHIDEQATRLGSRALFYSAVVTLAVNIALPFFVTEASASSRRRKQERLHPRRRQVNGIMGGGSVDRVDQYEMSPGSRSRDWSSRGLMDKLKGFSIPETFKVHLASLWAASHAIVAVCMLGTFFISSVTGATLLITFTGFSWAVTQWAPFALLGEAILTEPASMDGETGDRTSIMLTDTRTRLSISQHRRNTSMGGEENEGASSTLARRRSGSLGGRKDSSDGVESEPRAVGEDSETFVPGRSSDSESDGGESDDGVAARREGAERRKQFLNLGTTAGVSKVNLRPEIKMFGDDYGEADEEVDEEATLVGGRRAGERDEEEGSEEGDITGNQNSNLSDKAGIILGIHNIFIVIPQFIVTGISSIIFAIFDPDKNVGHQKSRTLSEDDLPKFSNSVAYIFRLGGFSAFVAFILCWQLARELRHR
ncbi:hypothetical protein K435DRAFT_777462 [Dendrothele bispora CBS 962.96]|uniref:MFS general substrate transporter n=1 Tax=Dendrothele bispora (strain CBS 962.96) TaxID=1314807 RepID=A0A4S8M9B9_DENBC|nr:hypothetical protein K435DRAFT_777462 [Dendrothele bispora CBS 962.96]